MFDIFEYIKTMRFSCIVSFCILQILCANSLSYALALRSPFSTEEHLAKLDETIVKGDHSLDALKELDGELANEAVGTLDGDMQKQFEEALEGDLEGAVEGEVEGSLEEYLIDTFEDVHSISALVFLLGLGVLSVVVFFTGISYWFLLFNAFFLIPLIYKFFCLFEKSWNNSFLQKIHHTVIHNIPIVLLFCAIFFVIEIFLHLGAHLLTMELLLVFQVSSLIGIILFCIPLFLSFYKILFKMVDCVRMGKNPLTCVGMNFIRGLVLLIFLILPLSGLIHFHFSVVAFIGVTIHLTYIFEMKSRLYQNNLFEEKKLDIQEDYFFYYEDSPNEMERSVQKVREDEFALLLQQKKKLIVIVDDGATIPRIDGYVENIILSGEGDIYVNKAFFTGEETPILVQKGSFLEGGSVVSGGTIHIRVEKVGDETTIGKMQSMLRKISNQKYPRMEGLMDWVGRYYLFIVFFLGTGCFVVIYLLSGSLALAITRALTVFIVICPCSFFIGIPLSYTSARFILLKKYKVHMIDNNAFLIPKVMMFDKTNTLTKFKHDQSSVHFLGSFEDSEQRQGDEFQKFLLMIGKSEFLRKDTSHHAKRIVDFLSENHYIKAGDLMKGASVEIDKENASEKFFLAQWEEEEDSSFYAGSLSHLKQYVGFRLSEEDFDKVQKTMQSIFDESVDTAFLFYDFKLKSGMILKMQNEVRENAKEFIDFYLDRGRLQICSRLLNFVSKFLFRTQVFSIKTFALIASGDSRESVKKAALEVNIPFGFSDLSEREKAFLVFLFQRANWIDSFYERIIQEQKRSSQNLDLSEDVTVMQFEEFKDYLDKKDFLKEKDYESLQKEFMNTDKKDMSPSDLANTVGFMGDGYNDRYAMRVADLSISFDVSIAMKEGNILVSVPKDSPSSGMLFFKLKKVFQMIKITNYCIFSNLIFLSILWNILIVILLFSSILTPFMAAILHASNTMLIIVFAMCLMISPIQFIKKILGLKVHPTDTKQAPKSCCGCHDFMKTSAKKEPSCCGRPIAVEKGQNCDLRKTAVLNKEKEDIPLAHCSHGESGDLSAMSA